METSKIEIFAQIVHGSVRCRIVMKKEQHELKLTHQSGGIFKIGS